MSASPQRPERPLGSRLLQLLARARQFSYVSQRDDLVRAFSSTEIQSRREQYIMHSAAMDIASIRVLPGHIQFLCLQKLDWTSLARSAAVCKLWREMVRGFCGLRPPPSLQLGTRPPKGAPLPQLNAGLTLLELRVLRRRQRRLKRSLGGRVRLCSGLPWM